MMDPQKPQPPDAENEIEALLAMALAGELRPDDAARLANLCQNEPAVLDALAQQTLTHRLLQSSLRDPDGHLFATETAIRIQSELTDPFRESSHEIADQVGHILKFRRIQKHALRFAAALAIGGALWWGTQDSATARIQRTEALLSEGALNQGQALSPGSRVQFTSGLLEIRFGCGAEVLLEGPAELEIQDAWHGTLKKGRLVAKVGWFAHGFTLDGPGGRIVDLGTRFAVSADSKTGMEVHVLEGLVETTPDGQSKPLQLRKNEAMRLGSGYSERISEADQNSFVTALPPKRKGIARCVHWGFEEEGAHTPNLGGGLGLTADLDLRVSPNTPGVRPRVQGPFGKALEFSGDGTYAESPFRGIGGNEARTVAFWVKVPSDFQSRDGLAVVSWGSRIQAGAAWQISINPTPEEGPLGRLRVGVNKGPVVGSTDLRDDQWHHCAVVMYGGSGADVSTHVLLYVDGQLEPAARKAVMQVRTDTLSPLAHGIWLGRNLSTTTSGLGPSFRGAIDEVFIFDAALNQKDILGLMQNNTP